MASRDPGTVGLTQEQLEQAKELFGMFDQNGDGHILASEIANILTQLGQEPSKEQVDAILSESDLDKNGKIDFEEFLKVTAHKFMDLGQQSDSQKNRNAFDQFDQDKDGYITQAELVKALQLINPSHTQADIDSMLKSSDINSDGKISFEEFCKFKQ